MKKSAETLLLLLLTMFSVVGCGVGPCAGYGCPGFTSAVAPQQPAKNAQNRKASDESRAQNDRAVTTTATSGQ